jgi:hypothetical protein
MACAGGLPDVRFLYSGATEQLPAREVVLVVSRGAQEKPVPTTLPPSDVKVRTFWGPVATPHFSLVSLVFLTGMIKGVDFARFNSRRRRGP